ncbi:DUF317 domain-containing protein [Streptomyces incarnatus]
MGPHRDRRHPRPHGAGAAGPPRQPRRLDHRPRQPGEREDRHHRPLPLTDAGWNHTTDEPWICWTSPSGDAGVQFDALTAQRPNQNLATWIVWAGPGPDRATWTITASPYTPRALLAALSESLAHGTGTRSAQTPGHERKRAPRTVPPSVPGAAGPAASRTRCASEEPHHLALSDPGGPARGPGT